jgi:hypothetical protein
MNIRFVCSSLLAVVLAGCTGGNPPSPAEPPPPVVASPGSLDAAHQAYLEGNWTMLGERIRDVLLDTRASDLAKDNAYALLDKAYEVQGGKLPTTFKLPPDFTFIKYNVVRDVTRNGLSYKVSLYGRLRDAKRIASITLRRLPGELVLETKGKLDIRKEEPGFDDFVVESGKIDHLPANGVFTVRIVFTDASTSEGWFIGHDLESTASPDLRSPSPSESLTDRNPLVTWPTFRSPQYLPFETRTLNIWVSREDEKGAMWDLWTGTPGETNAVRIGAHEGAPKTTLRPGDYWFALVAGEERQFGPFRLNRASSTSGPFHIVP